MVEKNDKPDKNKQTVQKNSTNQNPKTGNTEIPDNENVHEQPKEKETQTESKEDSSNTQNKQR